MCTSLAYRDAAERVYFGRTMELTVDLPYQLVYLPAGITNTSQIDGHAPLTYTAKYPFISVAMPARVPTAAAPMELKDLKVLEGLNSQGLTFSLLSYPGASGTQRAVEMTKAVLSASDLGSWILGQFATVAEVKAAMAAQPILLEPLAILGGVVSPFHYVAHDPSGAALVIEFSAGKLNLYDNPVGVMTNGPEFPWHLTNLDNYTFLSNVDKSQTTFGSYKATQPDSGIATAGLPSSNTSVGRFVRAAYYAQFAERAATPDAAVQTLAHVMNNFDRPKGITIDYPDDGGSQLEVKGLPESGSQPYATEYTCWTVLGDLDRKVFYFRDYLALSYSRFELEALATVTEPKVLAARKLDAAATDGAAQLISAA